MVRLRPAVGVATIWLATVAGVSATAWLAIDRAGRDVTGAAVSSVTPATIGPVATAPSPKGPSRTHVAPSPSPTAQHSASPKPATPTTSAAPTPATSLSSGPRRDRTLSVAGGQVSVRCTGATILLRIAQPDNGWRVEVDKSGPAKVDVSFLSGDDEGGGLTHVTAVCTSGTPTFSVDNKN